MSPHLPMVRVAQNHRRVASVGSMHLSESNSPINTRSTGPASFVSSTLGSRVVLNWHCARPGRVVDPLSILLVRPLSDGGRPPGPPPTIVMGMPGVRSNAPSILSMGSRTSPFDVRTRLRELHRSAYSGCVVGAESVQRLGRAPVNRTPLLNLPGKTDSMPNPYGTRSILAK